MSKEEARQQILNAIGAHGRWTLRLRSAAVNKRKDLSPDELGRDDLCDFGRWLKTAGDLVEDDPNLPRVTRLHREFHAEAGRIAGLITSGENAAALVALEPDQALSTVSSELASAMAQWRQYL